MRSLLSRTTDERFGRNLMTRFPTDGANDPAAYLDCVVELPDQALALTGIRFRGGDPSRPFVDIVALEGSLTADRLHPIVHAVAARWALFSPLCVRISAPAAGTVRLASFGPRSRVDFRVIAGRFADIRSRRQGGVDGLSVHAATDLSWHGQYRREYDRFLAADARRNEWTQPEGYDALVRATREAGVFLVRMHGELVGIYSMPRAAAHGLQGVRVQEKFLFESVRGKGLGTSVEHAVLEQLPANAEDVVFGSIAEGNIPSQRSAYRTGRVDIGAKLWLTPSGRPGMPT
jgi:hypothetical protein